MRRSSVIIIICVFSLMISSCNETTVDTALETSETAIESSSETSATTSSEETTSITTTESTTESMPETTNKALLYEKYKEALTKLRKDLIWPVKGDNQEEIIMDVMEYTKVSNNRFAITDVDCDGTDELIIEWTSTAGLAQFTGVIEYDVNTGEWKSEGRFTAFNTKFYDNGVLINPHYRNMDYGEVTWPYSIHMYDHENDKYSLDPVGDVVCFDREYLKYREEYIPSKKAKRMIKKDGVVYLISYPGYDPQKYYSKNEYNAFWQKLVGNAKQIKVKYYALTKKNINKIASID